MQIITGFQKQMIKKALKSGIGENFGQKELQKLKDKYGYNPFGTIKEREMAKLFDYLDNWLMNLDYNALKQYQS